METMVRMRAHQLQRESSHLCECTVTIKWIAWHVAGTILNSFALKRKGKCKIVLSRFAVQDERTSLCSGSCVCAHWVSAWIILHGMPCRQTVPDTPFECKTQRRRRRRRQQSMQSHSLEAIIVRIIKRKTSSMRLCECVCVCVPCVHGPVNRQCASKSAAKENTKAVWNFCMWTAVFVFIFLARCSCWFASPLTNSLALNSAFHVGHHNSRSI